MYSIASKKQDSWSKEKVWSNIGKLDKRLYNPSHEIHVASVESQSSSIRRTKEDLVDDLLYSFLKLHFECDKIRSQEPIVEKPFSVSSSTRW